MENWRKVWRDAVVPQLTVVDLEVLLTALETDDPRLEQGVTTTPPPMQATADWPVESACLLAYIGACRLGGFSRTAWRDSDGVRPPLDGAATVAQVEEEFARMCMEIGRRLDEPGGCRWLLNWWDEESREKVRQQLLEEVAIALGSFQERAHDQR